MKGKYLILILAILLVLSMNVASAADNTTKEVISLSEENALGDPASIGTFDELQKYIDSSATRQISLNKSYTYDSTESAYATGIKINEQAIKIDGNGYTIDGNHAARIFNITASDVVLKNINFVNGNATVNFGGAIYNTENNLTIINCTFSSNHAKQGGAIYTLDDMSIEDSTFKSNDAFYDTTYRAGAIDVAGGNVSIKNSLFDSNYANTNGAIYLEGNNMTLYNCTFKLNKAGGSGAIGSKGKYLEVNDCTFEYNNGTSGFGGAISNTGAKLIINNSTFIGNYVEGENGAALSLSECEALIIDSNFELQFSGHNGGAIYGFEYNNIKVINSTFKSNFASWYGGAIYLENDFEGVLNITNSTFESNSVNLDDENWGGAICFYPEGYNSYLFVYNSTFKSNTALIGGAIELEAGHANIYNCTFENNSANWGGAIFSEDTNLNIYDSTFKSNVAYYSDAGWYASAGHGGGVCVSSIQKDDVSTNIINSTFESNTADRGGAIWTDVDENNIYNCRFESNNASQYGGAIYSEGINIVIFNTTYEFNTAEHGGAIYSTGENASIDLAYFNANSAAQGSAIELDNDGINNTKIANVEFDKNKANSSAINIDIPEDGTYGPANVTVIVTFEGLNNIANAIYNCNGYNTVLLKNITCEFSKDGKGRSTKTFNENDFANPTDGFENETKLWQNTDYNVFIADAQLLDILITDEDDNVLINITGGINQTSENSDLIYTDVNGNIINELKNLKPGTYNVIASHAEDEYYTEYGPINQIFTIYGPRITKTTEDTLVGIGQNVTYNITLTNKANHFLSNITLTDLIPDGFELISYFTTWPGVNPQYIIDFPETYGNWTYDGSVFKINNTSPVYSSLESGKTIVLTLVFNATKTGTYNNTVIVTTNETVSFNETSESTIVAPVNLNVVKTANVTNVLVEDSVKFTINVTNIGLIDATEINVTDLLDPEFEVLEIGNQSYLKYNDTEKILWNIPSLNVGNTTSFYVIVRVLAKGTLNNTATVKAKYYDETKSIANVTVSGIPSHISVGNLTTYYERNVTIFINVTTDDNKIFSGNVTVTFPDDSGQIVKIVNGHGNVTWFVSEKYAPDIYNVSVKFSGDSKYSSAAGNGTITVIPAPSSVEGEDVEVQYGDNIVVPVTSENATGIIYEILDANGAIVAYGTIDANKNITDLDLAVGTYTVNLTTLVSKNYIPSNNISTITVIPAPSSVEGEDVEVQYGDNIVVPVTSENTTGIIYEILDANGAIVAYGTIDANKNITDLDLAAGTYTVNLTTIVNSNYTASNNISTITVIPAPSSVEGEDVEVQYGDNIVVPVTSENATGIIYEVIDANGAIVAYGTIDANKNITDLDLAAGTYTVNLTTIVNSNHTASNNISTITVKPCNSSVNVDSVDVVYGDDITIPVSSVNATSIDYIIIDGEGIVVVNGTVKSGEDINVYDLPAGEYIVKATTVTDENHSSASGEANLTVHKAIPIIKIEVVDILYGKVEVLNITVNAPGTVNVTVNGITKTLELISDSNGLLSYSLFYVLKEDYKANWNINDLPVGEYPVFAIYNGNENFESVNASDVFNVNPITPSINVTADDINVGDNLEIEISLPDDATGTVTIEIDGNNYTAPVKDGKAIISIPNLTAGNKTAKVYYSGDDNYLPSEGSTAFEVKKILPTLNIISDITAGKDGQIVITLPDDATGTVTIEIDGKTYTAPVENGKAIFTISGLTKGLYDIKVYYSGDDKYLPTNATGTIEVLPVEDKNKIPQKDKIKDDVKTGLSAYETGNPIVVLLLVLSAFVFSPLRKLKK